MKFNRRQRFAVYGGLLMSTAGFMALVNGGSVGALTTSPTTGAAVAADPTSSTAATATTASTASTTSTTAGPTTTTTVGDKQITLSGSVSDTNNCQQSINGGAPSPTTIVVGTSASAFPQPHKGQLITLSKTVGTVTVPAATAQLALTAGLKAGDTIPSVVTTVISASNTTEGTHTFTINSVSTIKVDSGGAALPLVGTSNLPNTTWHPKNATDPVVFAEKSIKVVSTLTIPAIGAVTAAMTCTPSGSAQFLALSAEGSAPPVTVGTTAPTQVTAAAATTTTTTVAAAANTLPRTGANGVYLLIIGAALLDAGAALLLMTRRKRHL